MSVTENTAQESLYESLSALVDGEANELELRRLLKTQDPELDRRWQRYHLIRAAMKGESIAMPVIDVSAAVNEALIDEPAHSKTSRLLPNLGRFAVAASVAAAVVLAVQFTPVQTGAPIANIDSTPAPASGQPILGDDTSVRVVSEEPQHITEKPTIIINEATQQQLEAVGSEVNRLILEHAQHASQNTQQGVLPYVRVPDAEQ